MSPTEITNQDFVQATLQFVIFFAQSALVGSMLLSHASIKPALHNSYFLRITAGASLNILVFHILAVFSVFTIENMLIYGAATVLTAFAIRSRRISTSQTSSARWRLNQDQQILFLLSVIVSLLVFFNSIKVPGIWDDTSFHLPIAQSIASTGSLIFDPTLRYPLVPQNANLLMASGFLAGKFFGAQVMATAPLVPIAIGLVELSKKYWGNAGTGITAFLGLFSITPFAQYLGYAFIDLNVVWFCFASTWIVIVMIGSRPSILEVAILGLTLGIAAGTKLNALAYASLFLLIAPIFLKMNWKTVTSLFLAFALTATPWYLRSYLISGDPIHPVGGPVFGYFLWDAQDLSSNRQEQKSHGLGNNLLHLPEQVLLIGAPILLLAFIFAIRLKKMSSKQDIFSCLIFFSYMFIWYLFFPVDRYVAPIVGIGLLLAARIIHLAWDFACTWTKKVGSGVLFSWSQKVPITVGLVMLLTFIPVSVQHSIWILDSWKQTLNNSRPGYVLIDYANKNIPSNQTLVQIGFENGKYFYKGRMVGDWFGETRYRDFSNSESGQIELATADKIVLEMNKLGANYILVNTDRLSTNLQNLETRFVLLASSFDGVLLKIK